MLNELSVDQIAEKCISANDPKAFSRQRNPGFNPINRIDFLLKKWQLKESNRAQGIEYRPMFVAAFERETQCDKMLENTIIHFIPKLAQY